MDSIPIEGFIQSEETKILYNLCKEYGIKFVINGQDRVNGVLIKKLLKNK